MLSYAASRGEALASVQALALRVLADRIEHGEESPDLPNIAFLAA